MKLILRLLLRIVKTIYRVNWIATPYVNLRLLPFSQAIKFPLVCYGKIKIHSLKGKVIINSTVKTGMIQIGYRWIDLWPVSYLPTQLNILGKVYFGGSAIISGGASINVQSRKAVVEMGKSIVIGGGSLIKSLKHISIGDRTRVTGFCTVMDCNMHFVKDITTGKIRNNDGDIHIGANCWINFGSVVTKGAYIPDYSITSRGAFIGKNFKEEGPNLFIAGSPGKVINNNVQRIFDYTREDELRNYFLTHPDESFYRDIPGVKDETVSFNIDKK